MSDKPSVLEALSNVMEDVQAVGKGDTNTQQGYKFRGVDAVVNAVGPALRKHGVIVVPTRVMTHFEHYVTSKGTPMRDVILTVNFRFYGPAGDSIDAQVCGESADSGDKAVPKAHSVAYRTLLLQALCIPTDEPDPDSHTYERASSESPSGVQSQTSGNGGSGESRRTMPQNLAELENLLDALKLADSSTDWRESAANMSARLFGERDFKKLKAGELDSVVKEVGRWLAMANPSEVPFG